MGKRTLYRVSTLDSEFKMEKTEEKKKSKEKGKTKAKSNNDKRQGEESGKTSTVADILSEPAMHNAYFICHNVQDLMYFRGFFWEGQSKGKGKGKKKKR